MNNNRFNCSSRRSKSWSSSVIGTHVSSAGRPSRGSTHQSRRRAQSLGGRTAELRQMNLNTSSVSAAAARPKTGRSFTKDALAQRRRRSIFLGLLVAVLVLALAFGLGSCAYKSSISGAMALNDDEAKSALVAPKENEPYYVLIAGLGDDPQVGQTASFLMLMRVDEQNKQISLLGIPDNIAVSLSKSGDYMLRDAVSVGGEKELISAVSSKLDIDIAHYIRTTEKDFVTLVDSLGGVHVNIEQRVDDPRVSNIVLNVGEQDLNGEEALAYVSAFNYKDGRTVRSGIQEQVLTSLIAKVQDKSGFDFITTADALSKTFKTDLGYEDLIKISDVYSSCENRYYANIPGSQTIVGDKTYYYISSVGWAKAKEKFMAGEDPQVYLDTSQVNKAETTVEVLNGSGSEGLATQVGDKLTQAGYEVTKTGNAPSYVYDETLIVYKEDKDALTAEAIVQDLGAGRTVSAGSFYTLETDIQVYVGKDWKAIG